MPERPEFKESLGEIYTQESISNMIHTFEESYNLNFSDEVYTDLTGKTDNYIHTALEIKEAIKIYENYNGKKFTIMIDPEVEEINRQMEEFNNKSSALMDDRNNNVISIEDGSEYKEPQGTISENISDETNNQITGFRSKIKALLKKIKK